MVIESKLLYALVDSFFGGNDVPYTKIEGKDFTQVKLKLLEGSFFLQLMTLKKLGNLFAH